MCQRHDVYITTVMDYVAEPDDRGHVHTIDREGNSRRFDGLQQAIVARDWQMGMLKVEPGFDALLCICCSGIGTDGGTFFPR
jgi:hypothetical protein